MRYLVAIVLSLLLAVPAWAQSVAFGSKLVTVGDSTGKVYQVAGKPDRVVQLQNKFGANTGERFEYYVGNKTVLITVRDGHVVEISEVF